MEENNWCVYKHTTPSGKVYIGITSQKPERRWRNGNGYKHGKCVAFWNAIKKYGWDNITHEILEKNLSNEDACEKEKQYIKQYQSTNPKFGYNIASGGSGCPGLKGEKNPLYGIPRSDKDKQTISEAIKKYYETHDRKPISDETRKKLSKANSGENNAMYGKYGELNPFYGKTHSEETRRIISEKLKGRESTFKGHKHTEQAKQIMREKALIRCSDPNYISPFTGHKMKNFLGKHHTEETKRKIGEIHSIPVYALNDEMEIILEFSSITEASRYFNCNVSSIDNCLHKSIEYTSNGYHWCKKEEYEDRKLEYVSSRNRINIIYQYSLDGNYIRNFDSAKEAEDETGIFATSIITCCNGRQAYAGDFQWRKYKVDKIDKVMKYSSWTRGVLQFSKTGEFIKFYESITIASKEVGCSIDSIQGCCRGRYKTGGGYIWRYADEEGEYNGKDISLDAIS